MVDKFEVKINKDVAKSHLLAAEARLKVLRLKISECDTSDLLELQDDFRKNIQKAQSVADMPVKDITYEGRKEIWAEVERLEKLHKNMNVTFNLNCVCRKR